MNIGNSVSKFYKSFSGTDTVAFLFFPGIKPIVLGSLTTISYSMYRNKVPVINIGRTNINGITRGSRIYAGTMVFTLINKHWVRELQDQADYLKDYRTIKTDELPLFDIIIVSANEYGNACSMFIYGVDFTDESQTISVEDLFTENVFKFVARDVSVFDQEVITASDKTDKKYYQMSTDALQENIIEGITPIRTKAQEEIKGLTRSLYYVANGNPLMGDDVAGIQQLLNLAYPENELDVNYKFDRPTDAAVRDFQARNGLPVDGIVDNGVYTKLLQRLKDDGSEYAQVINKSGTFIYREPDENSEVTETLPYLASAEIFSKTTTESNKTYYQCKNGYIPSYNVYNYKDNSNSYTYETIKFNDNGPQVTVLQNVLTAMYPNFADFESGTFDEKTESYVREFQSTHDLEETGTVDYYTWCVLLDSVKTETNYRLYLQNHTDVSPAKEPGVYNVSNLDSLNQFTTNIYNNNTQQVKFSTIAVFKNNKTKTDSKTISFEGEQSFSVTDFKNMFKDDIEYLNPTDIYYFIYPYGDLPLKWHFVMKG